MIGDRSDAGLVTFGEVMGLITVADIGSLETARTARIGIGGAEGNVAIGVARLGTPARWIGRVGSDAIGDLIAAQLRASGVRTEAIRDPSYTGIMIRHRRAGDAIQIDYHRRHSAGSHLSCADLPSDLSAARVLHVTGITPALSGTACAAVFHAVDVAQAAHVTISFDVNYRAKLWAPEDAAPVLRRLASRADVLFAGPAEARLLTGAEHEGVPVLARALQDLGPRSVVIKDGASGCYAVDGATELGKPAIPVGRVIDPVGAGDAFVAGFLAEHIGERSLENCLDTALRMGAFAVSVPGDCELLPTRVELAAFTVGSDVNR